MSTLPATKWYTKTTLTLVGFALCVWAYDSVFPPVSTLMLGRYLSAQPVTRDFVPLDRISPQLIRAVIAAEDGQFCNHNGIDSKSLQKQLDKLTGDAKGNVHGASTISMQTVKNLFLWGGRSYVRKALELPLTLFIEHTWSKKHILESYLNIAEWGDGIFGIEAAAQTYFQIPASELNRQQSALLAAMLPNPLERNPNAPSRYLRSYANTIRARASANLPLECLK